jgi:hypothetical protein
MRRYYNHSDFMHFDVPIYLAEAPHLKMALNRLEEETDDLACVTQTTSQTDPVCQTLRIILQRFNLLKAQAENPIGDPNGI